MLDQDKSKAQLIEELERLRQRVAELETHHPEQQRPLTEKNGLLNIVFDHLPAQVYVKDRQSRFILANAATVEALQLPSLDACIGKTDLEIFEHTPEIAAAFYAEEQALMQSGEPLLKQETLRYSKTNQPYWTVTSKLPLRDAAGSIIGLVGIGMDITARKEAENALTEERYLLKTIVEYLPAQVYVKDTESRFLLANAATREKLEISDEAEYLGKTDAEMAVHTPADAAKYRAEEQALMQSGQPLLRRERSTISSSNTLTWSETSKLPLRDISGNIIGLVGVGLDITKRKLARQALDEERNLLMTVLNHLPAQVYVKDLESRFVLANTTTMAGLHATESADYIGKTDADLIPHAPDKAAEYLAEEQELMRTGQPILNKEHTSITKDGTILWSMTSKLPMRDTEGNIIGMVGIGQNITERKQAEAERLALALEQERVTILANFIKDVSHEFRTPLTVLNTSLYILERSDDPQKRVDQLQILRDHLHYIEGMVEAMLTMSNLDAGIDLSHTTIDLNNLLVEIANRIYESTQVRNLNFSFTPADQLPTIQGNQSMLHRMLLNLMTNAIQYTPEGGTITARTYLEQEHIAIEIVDTGQGIAANDIPHIFERFYRVDSARTERRAGLGLAIAQKIAEIHGGRIEVESTLGAGSTFRVLLPVNPNVGIWQGRKKPLQSA